MTWLLLAAGIALVLIALRLYLIFPWERGRVTTALEERRRAWEDTPE